jgi:hypothetical protein
MPLKKCPADEEKPPLLTYMKRKVVFGWKKSRLPISNKPFNRTKG